MKGGDRMRIAEAANSRTNGNARILSRVCTDISEVSCRGPRVLGGGADALRYPIMPSRLVALLFGIAVASAGAGSRAHALRQGTASGPRIEVTFSKDARAEAVTGMVYVAISRDTRRTPIEQASPTGSPLFSVLVDGLAPTSPIVIDARASGYPVASLRDIP